MLINFKFWNKDSSEHDEVFNVPFAPMKEDTILYNDRYYTVTERGIDLNCGKYTKVHCREDELEHYKGG